MNGNCLGVRLPTVGTTASRSPAAGTTDVRLAAAGTAARVAVGPTCRRPLNRLLAFALALAVLVGCGPGESAKPASQPAPAAPSAPPPPPPPPVAKAPPAPAAQPASVVPQPSPAVPPPPVAKGAPSAPSNAVEKKAAVGAGEKGHYDTVGPIVTPIASYFAMREKLAYDIQIPQAMNLFKATEDRLPKSHEEFMQRIIKDNQIVLPQLPEGHSYIYDPKRGELMVRQPRPQ